MWSGLQWKFDLYQADKRPKPKVGRIVTAIKNRSVLDLKGMFRPPDGVNISIAEMRLVPQDFAAWDSVVPVGREFGSPDYERLAELDSLAFKTFGSMKRARRWLDAPHADLGGLPPEEVVKTARGFNTVKRLLRQMSAHKAKGSVVGAQ
ncbi:MAG: hypothetical protein A2Z93_05215 [Curvibacter sp. GWA2_64_110]|nr:MAG: hypothetical protein A2Z93_05215 [Curvibacter sp. GWA2_64_110]